MYDIIKKFQHIYINIVGENVLKILYLLAKVLNTLTLYFSLQSTS